jgi:ABC-2 type transport system ATP-binding protein
MRLSAVGWPESSPIIHIDRVTKIFQAPKVKPWAWDSPVRPSPHCALHEVQLSLDRRKILGLLGTNGAGKTTLLKILATLILPTSGRVVVNGYDVVKNQEQVKSIIGLSTSEERSFYWRLTGYQNLEFFAAFQGLTSTAAKARIQQLQDQLQLQDLDCQFGVYSTGMRHRLGIARALLGRPQILLLDEPTRSLDPSTARDVRCLIRDNIVGQMGCTVILTSHNLPEVEELCDHVAILHKGRLADCDTVEALQKICEHDVGSLARVFQQLTANSEAA